MLLADGSKTNSTCKFDAKICYIHRHSDYVPRIDVLGKNFFECVGTKRNIGYQTYGCHTKNKSIK